jgi:hypothetical protein
MIRTKFFKLPKTKEFNFVPRFYDERKEKLKLLEQNNTNKISAQEDDARLESLKNKISQRWGSARKANTQAPQTNLRLILIIMILGLFSYFAWQKMEPLLYQWLSK